MPRVQINISDEMKTYFEELSKETGASQSSLMCIAIKEYIDQKKIINAINPMLEQMKMLEMFKEVQGNVSIESGS